MLANAVTWRQIRMPFYLFCVFFSTLSTLNCVLKSWTRLTISKSIWQKMWRCHEILFLSVEGHAKYTKCHCRGVTVKPVKYNGWWHKVVNKTIFFSKANSRFDFILKCQMRLKSIVSRPTTLRSDVFFVSCPIIFRFHITTSQLDHATKCRSIQRMPMPMLYAFVCK